MYLFDPRLYEKVHILIVLLITLYYFSFIQKKNAYRLLNRKKGFPFVYVYAILFIVVVGFRPISPWFGDSIVYVNGYQSFSQSPERVLMAKDSFFYSIMWFCSQFMSVYVFFFLVEVLYIVPIIVGCNRLLKNNADIGLLICFAAFSFYSYSVNGIRNGLSLSLVFWAISLIQGNKIERVFSICLSIVAIACHASAALPVVCMILSIFIKKPKLFFIFWGLSIIISLLAGNSIANVFASLGFDDRLSDYIHPEIEEDIYTATGFRWDFIIYSTMPILLGWYVFFKKNIYNSTYLLLLGTYILANAFWIMVIRAEFSNRFAYLSWFLYPIVLCYPLLRLKIWPKTQGRKTAIIMVAHYVFTFFMVFLYK